MLVSWTRLLSGEWRDPLVARDTLIGCASAVLYVNVYLLAILLLKAEFDPGSRPLLAPSRLDECFWQYHADGHDFRVEL
jgi:hypothetical protein